MRLFTAVVAACLLASPVLAQDAVNAAYEAALAASPTPVMLRLGQEDWRAQWTEYPDERADMEEMRLAELNGIRERDLAIRAARLPTADLARACLETRLKNCEVENSGSLSMGDGSTVWFQQQTGHTDEDGISTAMVVMTTEGEQLKPIFWLVGAIGVMPLEIYQNRDGETSGPTYVAVPAYGQGTGNQWVGTMFRWNGPDAAPTEIDALTWLATLDEALPEGLGVWKGPEFHWSWLSAESPLWQDDDANCCATGGRVHVDLAVEGDALIASSVSVEDAILEVARSVQPDVLEWVSRRRHCNDWQGLTVDDDSRVEIAEALDRLQCAALDADEAALRTAHADEASTLALLNRAKVREPAPE